MAIKRYKSAYELDGAPPEKIKILEAKGKLALEIRGKLERLTGLDQERIILFLEGRTSQFSLEELIEIWANLQKSD